MSYSSHRRRVLEQQRRLLLGLLVTFLSTTPVNNFPTTTIVKQYYGRFVGCPSTKQLARRGTSLLWSQDRFCPTFQLPPTTESKTIHDLQIGEANRQRRETRSGKQRNDNRIHCALGLAALCANWHTPLHTDKQITDPLSLHPARNPQFPQSTHEL